ncbi:MAG: FMN-binding negative transcriptional regulator, partial [Anaerolineales bacterium]|nr:FMN-binding negative transcriptional regulator [Anaerolineales bacterium]
QRADVELLMVHVYGKVRMEEGDEFSPLLRRLVGHHEAHSDYRLESLPQDFVKKEMNGTVGFAVDVTRIDAGYKLSQNRNDEDHANIIHELEGRGDVNSVEVANGMRGREQE